MGQQNIAGGRHGSLPSALAAANGVGGDWHHGGALRYWTVTVCLFLLACQSFQVLEDRFGRLKALPCCHHFTHSEARS